MIFPVEPPHLRSIDAHKLLPPADVCWNGSPACNRPPPTLREHSRREPRRPVPIGVENSNGISGHGIRLPEKPTGKQRGFRQALGNHSRFHGFFWQRRPIGILRGIHPEPRSSSIGRSGLRRAEDGATRLDTRRRISDNLRLDESIQGARYRTTNDRQPGCEERKTLSCVREHEHGRRIRTAGEAGHFHDNLLWMAVPSDSRSLLQTNGPLP